MKKLSSTSASSSSSSFSSFTVTTTINCVNGNIHTSKSSALGCISGMVRRLLCWNSLPTYPCDQLKLPSTPLASLECLKKENEDETLSAAAHPGLVARLMGLESLPKVTAGGHDQKITSPNSISRSRSMNSVDALKEIASIQGRCRRVKSFREIPTFVEDDEFLILSFENEEKKTKTKQSKAETGRGKKKIKRRKSVYDKNKENQEPDSNGSIENLSGKIMNESISNINPHYTDNSLARIRMGKSSVNTSEIQKDDNEISVKRPAGKTRDDHCFTVKKIEEECDSEYSSPNSVLDATVFPCDSQITHSAVEHSRTENSNSKTRRTLAEELQNYKKLNFTDTKSCKKTAMEKKGDVVKFRDRNNPRFVKIWGDICKLVEKEANESVWMYKGIHKLEDDGEDKMLGEVEVEILDELVDVLVHELCR